MGKSTKYNTVSNDDLKSAINSLYNEWFLKWKNCEGMETHWEECVSGLSEIIENYAESDLVFAIGRALLTELEERERRRRTDG